jgi:type VI secretion system protein ImpA
MTDLPDGFDLEALLAPIPGDAPLGIDIGEDFSAVAAYSRLRDARSEARGAKRGQGAGGDAVRDPGPLWRSIGELGITTLAETTKDLEVGAWVTEALVRGHGLAGFAAGARLMAGLTERSRDGLFLLLDGNGLLIQPLSNLAAFNRTDGTPVALDQFDTLGGERRQRAGAAPGALPAGRRPGQRERAARQLRLRRASSAALPDRRHLRRVPARHRSERAMSLTLPRMRGL